MKLEAPDYPSGKHGWMVVLVTALIIFSAGLMMFSPSQEKITGGQVYTESFQITVNNNVNTANYSYAEEFPNDKAGTALDFGDINGDGLKDIVIGAYGYLNGNGDGKVYLIYRPLINGSNSLSSANVSWTTSSSNESLGYALAVGNVNNDAYQDVLIGARWKDNASGLANDSGGAYLFYGAANLASSLNANNSANATFYGENQNDMAGSAVAIGDVSGDGIGDVIIGAPFFDSNSPLTVDDGKVYIFFGPISHGTTLSLTQANATFKGVATSNGNFGTAIEVGDINGDSKEDLVIGAIGLSQAYLIYGPIAQGTSGVISTLANVTFNSTANSQLGDTHTISLGEVNGDGYNDILIGAPDIVFYGGAGESRAFLIYGNNSLNSSIDLNASALQFVQEAFDDVAGYSTAITDYNGDGNGDVLISAPGNDEGGNLAGKIYLLYGPFNNSIYNLSTANESWYGSAANEGLGIAKAGTIVMAPMLEGFGTFKISLIGEEIALPLADFNASPTTGDASLAVTFTDASTGATSWAWDFQNDGIVDSTLQNPSFTYTTAGTYTVVLTVKNEYGTSTKTMLNYITVTAPVVVPPPSGGGGCTDECFILGVERDLTGSRYQVCEQVGRCNDWVTKTRPAAEIPKPVGVLKLILPEKPEGVLRIVSPKREDYNFLVPGKWIPPSQGCRAASLNEEEVWSLISKQETSDFIIAAESSGNKVKLAWAVRTNEPVNIEFGLLGDSEKTLWVHAIDYPANYQAEYILVGASLECDEEVIDQMTSFYVSDGEETKSGEITPRYVEAQVSYARGQFNILKSEIKTGAMPKNAVGHYVWAMRDANGEVLDYGLFGFPDEMKDCNRVPLETTATIYLPFIADSKIEIKNLI